MSVGGLFYQMLEIHAPRAPFGPNLLPQPDGDRVRLSARAPHVLVGQPIAGTVNHKLDVLASRIRASMPVVGGVLIGVSIDEAEATDDRGVHEQALVGLDILGVGRVPQLVLSIHQRGSRTERTAPSGWSPRTIYFWATT